MANNYTQFSFAIPNVTPDEAAWVKALKAADEANAANFDENSGFAQFADDGEYFGANVELDEDGVWVYADESGTPEDAATFVQAFLVRFRPTEVVWFEWANTCDRPRLDEFGGGGALVSATGVDWCIPHQMMTELVARREQQQVVVLTGNPGDGFTVYGPATPNTPEIEAFTERERADWWYLPLNPLPEEGV